MGVRPFLCVSLDCSTPTGTYYNLDMHFDEKHQLRLSCLFGNMCGFWRKNVVLCRRIFVEKGEYTGDDPLLYSKRHDGECSTAATVT